MSNSLTQQPMKYIGLIDCNNFFVSCERLFRPDLVGKPVVVISSNDGCVVARSQEIKDRGIPMGVPYFQIKDNLATMKATVFSSHLALYRDVSRRVFETVRESYQQIEQYSVDESFFSFESNDPEQLMTVLKRQIEQQVGIPVSIGVATSKTRAKYVNSVAKKTGGIAVWDNVRWETCAANIRLSEIWGVGAGRSKKFTDKGIITVADLLQLEASVVGRLFGIEGVRLQTELAGNSIFEVKKQKLAQKSVMSTRSFSSTIADFTVLQDAVFYHLYQGVKDLEAMNLVTVSLRVMIAPSRHGDFVLQGASKEVLLTAPTRDLFVLQQVATKLLKDCFKSGVPYKKAGIVMSGLVAPESLTSSLFGVENEKDNLTTELSRAIFAINKQHGKALLQLGRSTNKAPNWRARKDFISPAYTTNWSDLRVVQA